MSLGGPFSQNTRKSLPASLFSYKENTTSYPWRDLWLILRKKAFLCRKLNPNEKWNLNKHKCFLVVGMWYTHCLCWITCTASVLSAMLPNGFLDVFICLFFLMTGPVCNLKTFMSSAQPWGCFALNKDTMRASPMTFPLKVFSLCCPWTSVYQTCQWLYTLCVCALFK